MVDIWVSIAYGKFYSTFKFLFQNMFSFFSALTHDIIQLIKIVIFKNNKIFNLLLINRKGGDHSGRRFLRYSLFAWGIASVFVLLALIMELGDVPLSLKPSFQNKCWFDRKY